MKWIYDDGGRADAGYKGDAGDCFCRAAAIAAERPYKEVYDLINQLGRAEHITANEDWNRMSSSSSC